MPCPNCAHTIQLCGQVNDDDGIRIRHCPRCGTMVFEYMKTLPGDIKEKYREDVYTPTLIERCRMFEEEQLERFREGMITSEIRQKWHTLGIREAINTPDNRPK